MSDLNTISFGDKVYLTHWMDSYILERLGNEPSVIEEAMSVEAGEFVGTYARTIGRSDMFVAGITLDSGALLRVPGFSCTKDVSMSRGVWKGSISVLQMVDTYKFLGLM